MRKGKVIIDSRTKLSGPVSLPSLNISEFFMDSIQGEGPTVGTPAAFLRLQGCTLRCSYCDTKYAWNPYHVSVVNVNELLDLMEKHGLVKKLAKMGEGYHLVITGGSPLFQQGALEELFEEFYRRHGFVPIIEVENECVIKPSRKMDAFVSYWNNSPKLSTSGMDKEERYFPEVLKSFEDSTAEVCYKFVITRGEEDWKEIEEDFINPGFVLPEQIWLMPEGRTRQELEANIELTLELCVKNGVHYSPRLQIDIWGDTRGV